VLTRARVTDEADEALFLAQGNPRAVAQLTLAVWRVLRYRAAAERPESPSLRRHSDERTGKWHHKTPFLAFSARPDWFAVIASA
jgi:hypothetical protein